MNELVGGRLVCRHIEFGPASIHVEFERVELLADAFERFGALEALLVPHLGVLGILLLLFFGLLGSNDSLVPQRSLKALEL